MRVDDLGGVGLEVGEEVVESPEDLVGVGETLGSEEDRQRREVDGVAPRPVLT